MMFFGRSGSEGRISGGGWQEMESAPRDGTAVELVCYYGIMPWYGLFKWEDGCWQDATDPHKSVREGHLKWRPYDGDASDYSDPTGGRQETREYWL